MIITGGVYTKRIVSRYGSSGHKEDLPSLNQGRYLHGCGGYRDDSGNQVIVITYTVLTLLTILSGVPGSWWI